ncbi:hypothetical protein JCM8097_002989 [Rhodosporidiobolus ruineniae]
MSTSTNTDSHKVLVCVTGASGFIGAAVALRCLDLGHSVRLPLRTQAQLDAWTSKYGEQYGKRLEVVLLGGSIDQHGVFDEIVQGCEVVIHVASPAVFDIKADAETDILKPAIKGTTSILESAKKAGSVKSVAITSSIAAYLSVAGFSSAGPETVLSETSWNEVTYEEAAKMTQEKAAEVYSASKALAEKTAWDFVKQPDVHFSLSTIAPANVVGYNPAPTVKTLADVRGHSSFGVMVDVLWDQKQFLPLDGFQPRLFVGIADTAHAHVAAALNPHISNGHRYFLAADVSSWEELVRSMLKAEPALEEHLLALPRGGEKTANEKKREEKGMFSFEGDRAEKDFGFKYEPFDEYVAAFAKQVAELARAGASVSSMEE